MKTFKFSLVLRIRENTDVFISLDDNIYGIHSKRINILYISLCVYLSIYHHQYKKKKHILKPVHTHLQIDIGNDFNESSWYKINNSITFSTILTNHLAIRKLLKKKQLNSTK